MEALKIVNYNIDTWTNYKKDGKFTLFGENIDL